MSRASSRSMQLVVPIKLCSVHMALKLTDTNIANTYYNLRHRRITLVE